MALGQNNSFQFGNQTPFSTGLSSFSFSTNQNTRKSNRGNDTLVTYNSRYPGFDEEDYKRLEQIANAQGVTGSQKAQLMDELYQYYYPQVLNKHKLDERQVEINNSVYENGDAILNGDAGANFGLKFTQLSQKAKEKFNIPYDMPDNEVIGAMADNIPDGRSLLTKYINTGSPDLLYAAGIYDKPPEAGGITSIINKQSEMESDSTLGKIWNGADWVNIVGKGTEALDNLIQKIPNFTFEKKVENLANRMNNLSEDELDNLYSRYVKMVENGTDPNKWKNDNRNAWELFWDALTGDKDALDRLNAIHMYDYSSALKQDGITRNQWGDKVYENLLGSNQVDMERMVEDSNLSGLKKDAAEAGLWGADKLKNLLNFVGGSWGALENYAEFAGVASQELKDLANGNYYPEITDNLLKDEDAFTAYVANQTATAPEALTNAPETLMGVQYNPNVAKLYANIPTSFLKTLSSKVRAKTNPLDTKVGLLKMIFTEEGQAAMINRYGTVENLINTMENDPVGLASDVIDWGDKINWAFNKASGGAVPRRSIGDVTDVWSDAIVKGGPTGFRTKVKGEDGQYLKNDDGSYVTRDVNIDGINQGMTKASDWLRNKGWDRTANWVNWKRDLSTNPSTKQLKQDLEESGRIKGNDLKDVYEGVRHPINTIAEKASGSRTAQDKLFQAQEPTLNRLSKERNTNNIRNKAEVANELIVKDIQKNGGELPTDTQSRVNAHERAMKNKWKEITDALGENGDIKISTKPLADDLDNYIAEIEKLGISKNKSDLAALKEQSADLRALGEVDLLTLEKQKEMINANLNDWDDKSIGNVYKNGMTELTRKMGAIEDNIISKIPGDFQDLKNDFGALKDGYGDVVKANVKAQRAKYSDSISNYSRIKGIGEIFKGVKDFDLGEIGKGTAQLVGGEVTAKLRDKDWLIEQGFKDLATEMESPTFKSAKKNKAGQPVYPTSKK